MKILVTGSTGFVGSHLCDLLVGEGHQVYSLARNKKKFDLFKVAGTCIEGDLENLSWIDNLPAGLDSVVHVAGLVHTFKKEEFFKVNEQGTRNLLTTLKGRYKKLKLVLISSLAGAGPNLNNDSLDEDSTPCPVSDYGRSKLAAEKVLESLEGIEEWEKVVIRPPIVIGPRDPGFLEIYKMVKGGYFLTVGSPVQKQYSFVGVFDLVKTISVSLNYEHDNKTTHKYYSCHDRVVTLLDLVDSIKKAFSKKKLIQIRLPKFILPAYAGILSLANRVTPLRTKVSPDKINELFPDRWVCSNKKSKDILKMQYQWDLDRIVVETYKDYQSRGWI